MKPVQGLALLWLAAGLGLSGAAGADTLVQALTRSVTQMPDVRAARANRLAYEQAVTQARAAWYPSLDLSLGQGRETSNNPSTRILGSDQTLNRREAEVNLSQLVFDGGAASGQVRRYEARAQGAEDQLRYAAETTAAKAAQAYLEVARLRELLPIADDNVLRHRQTLEQVAKLADSGRGRRADAQQAEARYALAQASLAQLRGQLLQAEAGYQHLTGIAPGELEPVASLSTRLPVSLDAALSETRANHPAIRAAQKDLAAAQADRDTQRTRLAAPRIALEVGSSANHDLDGLRGVNSDRYAMLRLRYNLYRGGADEARLREAEARVDEALANYAKAANDAERELRLAWHALAEDRERLPQLERYASASAQVVNAYRLQFSIGQRTLLDVLNSENEWSAAKSNRETAAYAVNQDELRLLAAMGKLLATLGIDVASDGPASIQLAQPMRAELSVQEHAYGKERGLIQPQAEAAPQAPVTPHASRHADPGAQLRLRLSSSLDASAPLTPQRP